MLSVRPTDEPSIAVLPSIAPAASARSGRHAAADDLVELEWVTIAPIRPLAPPRPEPLPAPPTGPEPAGLAERLEYLDRIVAIKRAVQQTLLDRLGPALADSDLDEDELAARVAEALTDVIQAEPSDISRADRQRVINEVSRELLGLGPIESLLCDDEVTQIMVNGPDHIFVECAGRIRPVAAGFTGEHHLRRTIAKLVEQADRDLSESRPVLDARLPDGSRLIVVLPPVALDGPVLTIRKSRRDALTTADLIRLDTLTPVAANVLAACVRARLNILISGGPGSGKTATLDVLSSFVPNHERIVTIEDAAELRMRRDNVVRLTVHASEGAATSMSDLVGHAQHLRPDRIVVGEVGEGAAGALLRAMTAGHDGTLTTVRADSPRAALTRLETMVLTGGVQLPPRNIREQFASSIDVVVHQSLLRDGSRRITRICEVSGVEFDAIALRDLFVFDQGAGIDEHGRLLGKLEATGVRPMFLQQLDDAGIELPDAVFNEWT
jgi:pilus assembly protein CpaF